MPHLRVMELFPTASNIDVWVVDLDSNATSDAAATLSDRELQRAGRFINAIDRRRYIASVTMRRAIVSQYLEMSPAAIVFACEPSGKPYVVDASEFCFSVTRAGSYGAVAIAYDRAVGIDVEAVTEPCPIITSQAFSPREIESLAMSANTAVQFFQHWTMKEAFLKMRRSRPIEITSHGGGDAGYSSDNRKCGIATARHCAGRRRRARL